MQGVSLRGVACGRALPPARPRPHGGAPVPVPALQRRPVVVYGAPPSRHRGAPRTRASAPPTLRLVGCAARETRCHSCPSASVHVRRPPMAACVCTRLPFTVCVDLRLQCAALHRLNVLPFTHSAMQRRANDK